MNDWALEAMWEKGNGKEEAAGGCLSGNLAQNDSGCTEWAFLCLQRADIWSDSMSCPHIPSFLLAV